MKPLPLLLTVAALAVACGSGSSSGQSPSPDSGTSDDGGGVEAGDDGGGGDGAAGYPAPHPPMPQAITKKGPVMTAPKIVAITFPGDSLQASVDTFVTQLVAATAYWGGATSQYGVGPLAPAATVHSTDTPAALLTDADVRTYLKTKIQAGAGFPQPDANTVYALFYPDGTNVDTGNGVTCQQLNGYHDDFILTAGTYVAYTVVPRCPPPVQGVTVLDELTAEASHEIIEAATDPLPSDKPAYIDVDAAHEGWTLLAGGEIGDMCAGFGNVFYTPPGITNLVQRVWSNKAAAASHDPCEPQGTSPYFNSAPVETDTIVVNGVPAKGVKIAVGQSKTVELDLYSDAPTTGPWKVSVLDISSMFFGTPPALSFTLDKSQGQNGDKLQLTIKALTAAPGGAAVYWIQNDLGTATTVWLGVVGQ